MRDELPNFESRVFTDVDGKIVHVCDSVMGCHNPAEHQEWEEFWSRPENKQLQRSWHRPS